MAETLQQTIDTNTGGVNAVEAQSLNTAISALDEKTVDTTEVIGKVEDGINQVENQGIMNGIAHFLENNTNADPSAFKDLVSTLKNLASTHGQTVDSTKVDSVLDAGVDVVKNNITKFDANTGHLLLNGEPIIFKDAATNKENFLVFEPENGSEPNPTVENVTDGEYAGMVKIIDGSDVVYVDPSNNQVVKFENNYIENVETAENSEFTETLTKFKDNPSGLIEDGNEADFNSFVDAAEGFEDNADLKAFCAKYWNIDASQIVEGSIDAQVTSGDSDFIDGKKIIQFTALVDGKQVTNKISFGKSTDLADDYTDYIKAGKLTATNFDEKLKKLDSDDQFDGLTDKKDTYATAIAEQIAQSPDLQGAFFATFAPGGTIDENMLTYLGTTPEKRQENLKNIKKSLTDQDQQDLVDKMMVQSVMVDGDKAKNLTETIKEGKEAFQKKFDTMFGGIKNTIFQIMESMGGIDAIKEGFAALFGIEDPKFLEWVGDSLIKDYQLDKDKIAVAEELGEGITAKSMDTMQSSDLNTLKASCVDHFVTQGNFKQIDQSFIKYISEQTDKTFTIESGGETIVDPSKYEEFVNTVFGQLNNTGSDLYKNLQSASQTEGYDMNMGVMIPAMFMNFQDEGKYLKYLRKKNFAEETTQVAENSETTDKGTEALNTFSSTIEKTPLENSDLIKAYDGLLDGSNTDLLTQIGKLSDDEKIKIFDKFDEYVQAIKDQGLENAYGELPTEAITSVSFENNTFTLNGNTTIEAGKREKEFPKDMTDAITTLKDSKNVKDDHNAMLKAFNSNFDDIATQYKKQILTGEFNTKDFLTTLANPDAKDFEETTLRINNSGVDKDKSEVTVDDGKIIIQLNNENGEKFKTITVTKNASSDAPNFTVE